MAKLRVEGHESLVRDTVSNAVINSSTSEYTIYMARHRARNKQSDELRNACKEINTLNGEIEKSNVLKNKLEAIKNNSKPNYKFYNAWNMNHKHNFDIKIIQQLSICQNRVAFLEKELNRSKNKLGTLILQKKHIEKNFSEEETYSKFVSSVEECFNNNVGFGQTDAEIMVL